MSDGSPGSSDRDGIRRTDTSTGTDPARAPAVAPRTGGGGVFLPVPRLATREMAQLLAGLDALAGREVTPLASCLPSARSRPLRRPARSPGAPRPDGRAATRRRNPRGRPAQGATEATLGLVRARLIASLRPAAGDGVVELERGCCLDLAAELSELADALQREGCCVEALALEGMQGRLVDALVGAGLLEPLSPGPGAGDAGGSREGPPDAERR